MSGYSPKNIEETAKGVLLRVYVKPRSANFDIRFDGDEIVAFCRENPVQGRVNKEIVKELTKLLRMQIQLVSGATSKQKVFLIANAKKDQVERALKGC